MKKLIPFIFIFFFQVNQLFSFCSITWEGSPCVGSTINFTGSASGTTHDWTFEDATGSKSTKSGSPNSNFVFTSSGIAKILYITTVNGTKCSTTLNINIKQNPKVRIKLTTLKSQCFEKNSFCFIDSSNNLNGAKIIKKQYEISDGQFFDYTIPENSLKNKFCFSVKSETGGDQNVFIKITDENGCIDTMRIIGAITVKEKIGAKFSSNKPVSCDSVVATINNSTLLNVSKIKSTQWNWGDGTTSIEYGPKITRVFKKEGSYNSTMIVTTIDGCHDTFIGSATATVIGFPKSIKSNTDSACLSNSTIKFTVNEIPKNFISYLWNFGDPSSGPNNTNNKTLSPEHTFSGLGPFLVKLTLSHSVCGTRYIYDTITILGPASAIESAFQRVADYETYQCPKDIMDTVHFRKNLSTFYHNDKNYTDDDSMFYRNGTKEIGHNFQWNDPSTKKNPKQIWQKPYRSSFNTSGIKSVYAGTESPGGGFDPLKRERGTVTRLWDFGDNYAPKCTTDTKAKKNIRVNCAFSRDSIPNHYYQSWDNILLTDYKNVPMEDGIFIESSGLCKRVSVWPDSIFWIVRDTFILVPNSTADLNTQKSATYVGNKHTTFWKEKGLRGICERYMENNVNVQLNTGDSIYINGVLKKGPTTFTVRTKQILSIRSKTDSVTFLFTPYLKLDTLPNNLLSIRLAKGENPVKLSFFKRKPAAPLLQGFDYFIDYKRYRELYYAKIPQCNNVTLTHQDTWNKFKCESKATKQLILLHANAGGAGSGMIKDAVECLGSDNPSFGVTFLLSELKPGGSFTEVKINYDTACGNGANNWIGLNNLFPGGRPLNGPLPYWNTGYQLAGNVPNKFSKTYNASDVCGKNGCVTVGIIVGNGIAPPGGSSGKKPLCSDTHYYANFACFPKIDGNFNLLNIKKNTLGDYKICKNNPVLIGPSTNNVTQVKDVKSIRYSLINGNAGPNYMNTSANHVQEDYYHNQTKVPGKNPNYLYNYLVVSRFSENPKPVECSSDWKDGQQTLSKKTDTIYTAEYKKFKLAADISKVWEIFQSKLEARGIDPFSLADTQIVKLIWNSKGIIGNPLTGAYGCIDTSGFGHLISYYFVPDLSTKTILHYRDTSLKPVDMVTYYDPIAKKTKTSNAYKFIPKSSGYHIAFFDITSKNGLCAQTSGIPIIVGYANQIRLSDSIVAQRRGNSLIASTDFRYFSTDPANYGMWDPLYQWNTDEFSNPNGYDYWRDPKRLTRLAMGDSNVEKYTRWDWNKADDKTSTPFGGAPYGATGAGTKSNPWKQLGDGNLYYSTDTGVYIMRVASSDSTGCLDTNTLKIYVTRAEAKFNLQETNEACNNTFTLSDQSKLLDPCSWAIKSCNSAKTTCDFINKWEIYWGDSTVNTYSRSSEVETGIPYKVSHNYKTNGWHTITYKIYSYRGDYDSMTQKVLVKGVRPKFEFTNLTGHEITICQGQSVSFTNKSDSATVKAKWSWNFGDGEFYFGPDSTWFKNAPKGNPYAPGYFVDTVIHTFNKTGVFFVQLEQNDQVKLSTGGTTFCSSIFPHENSLFRYKVIVEKSDSVRGAITRNHINPGDSITFIDNSDPSLDVYKWKFKYFKKSTNKWIVDSITTNNKVYTRIFTDTGDYSVELISLNSNNLGACNTGTQKFSFRVDNNKIGVTNLEQNWGISLTPNPVRDLLKIKTKRDFESMNYSIIDYSGRKVKNGILSAQIDVSSLSSGSYIILIDNFAFKFVKTQ